MADIRCRRTDHSVPIRLIVRSSQASSSASPTSWFRASLNTPSNTESSIRSTSAVCSSPKIRSRSVTIATIAWIFVSVLLSFEYTTCAPWVDAIFVLTRSSSLSAFTNAPCVVAIWLNRPQLASSAKPASDHGMLGASTRRYCSIFVRCMSTRWGAAHWL